MWRTAEDTAAAIRHPQRPQTPQQLTPRSTSNIGSSFSVVRAPPNAAASSLSRFDTLHRTRQDLSAPSVKAVWRSVSRASLKAASVASDAALPSVVGAFPPLSRRARATQPSTDISRTLSCSSALKAWRIGKSSCAAAAPAAWLAAVTVMAVGTGGGTAAAVMSPVSTLNPSRVADAAPAPAPVAAAAAATPAA